MHSILIAVFIFSAGVLTGYLASIGQLLLANFLAQVGTAKTEDAKTEDPAVHTKDGKTGSSEAAPENRVKHVISCNGMVHTPFCSQSGCKSFTLELCEPCTKRLHREASAKNKFCTKCK